MADSYRSYLQGLANSGNKEALGLLQIVGDDGRVDDTFQRAGVNVNVKGGQFSKDQINQLNTKYAQSYTNPGGASGPAVLGASTGGGRAGTPAYDTSGDRAYLDDQESALRSLLGKSGTYLNQGLQSVNDNYAKESNRQKEVEAQTMRGFDDSRTQTTQDKLGALNKVDTNARTLNDSLRRILGLAGAASSSAAQYAAPGAVARQASQQRTGVNDQFGHNLKSIDTASADAVTQFAHIFDDLKDQRNQKEKDVRTSIGQQDIGTQEKLAEVARQRALLQGGGYDQVRNAMAPFRTAIDQTNNTLDDLFNKFRTPYTAQAANVAKPQLADYTVDRAAIDASNQSGAPMEDSPYAQFLKRKTPGLA